jgi:hypothetical protein
LVPRKIEEHVFKLGLNISVVGALEKRKEARHAGKDVLMETRVPAPGNGERSSVPALVFSVLFLAIGLVGWRAGGRVGPGRGKGPPRPRCLDIAESVGRVRRRIGRRGRRAGARVLAEVFEKGLEG